MFCFREPLTLQINACRLPGLCLPLVYHPCPYAQIQNKPKLWLKKKRYTFLCPKSFLTKARSQIHVTSSLYSSARRVPSSDVFSALLPASSPPFLSLFFSPLHIQPTSYTVFKYKLVTERKTTIDEGREIRVS